LDLFSGAGGLSLGLKRAGFQAAAAIEVDEDSCATYRNSFPEVNLIASPVQSVDFTGFESIELIAGGPPCQPFSSGGKQLADKDSRNLNSEFVRAVREARPRAFLLENVPGLAGPTMHMHFKSLLSSLEGLGYTIAWKILNAADYGVPQKRRRLFVVGLRSGTFEFPAPSHGPGKDPYVTAGSILDKAKVIGEPNPSKVVYAKNPDLRPSPFDGHLFNGGGRPVRLDAPCHTILAAAGGNKTHFLDTGEEVPPYHRHLLKGGAPREGQLPGGRRLTIEESALIQSFPAEMRFAGSRSSQYTQIGNAVPPRLAEAVASALRAALN
jgi:DNA (cytosine-5)-methyltransferase 1